METELFRPDIGRHLAARTLRRPLRTLVLALRGFVKDEAFHHAAALSFDTVLALVPMLVIAFAMLRGLGAYDAFLYGTLHPFIETNLGSPGDEQATLREALLQILALGENADLGALGFVGLLLLLYLVAVLLTTMETVFNRIWGAQRPRTLLLRLTYYAAILFVVPFALSFATMIISLGAGAARSVGTWPGILDEIATAIAAIVVLTFVYLVIPHTRVRLRSALAGGIVAGVMWTALLYVYTTFQIGVGRQNALYSGLAAVPLFLVWVFASWLVVLFGVEIAAADQSPSGFRWRIRHRDPSPATRRRIAVRFVLESARAFVSEAPPPTLRMLTTAAGIPERLAREILEDLVRARILVHAVVDRHPAYALARDPSTLFVSDVLHALDETEDPHELAAEATDRSAEQVRTLVGRLDRARAESAEDVDFRALIARMGGEILAHREV